MKTICYPFAVLATIGLLLSLVIHIIALTGRVAISSGYMAVMHIGVFVVFFPAILSSQRITREFKQKDQWKAALRGCPPWVTRALQVLGGYALLNFIRLAIVKSGEPRNEAELDPTILWGFSGHWMVFYASAWAMLYSAMHVESADRCRRCANGHAVSPFARFCEECGSPVTRVEPGVGA